MNASDVLSLLVGVLTGVASSTVFVLALFIGFCVIVGFTKTRKTAGTRTMVIKSLDETISRQRMAYLLPSAPHGTVDQLHTPELVEAAAAAARK
jgi:hypothetical protein